MHWRDRRQSHLKPASPHIVFADSNTTRARKTRKQARKGEAGACPRRDGPMSVIGILRHLFGEAHRRRYTSARTPRADLPLF